MSKITAGFRRVAMFPLVLLNNALEFLWELTWKLGLLLLGIALLAFFFLLILKVIEWVFRQ